MTETIIFSFGHSSLDLLSEELVADPSGDIAPDGTPTFTPHGSASATISASRFVSIAIVLRASRGVISHPDAGVAWSMDVTTSDRLSFHMNASASFGVMPDMPPDPTPSNPSNPPSPNPPSPNPPGTGSSAWSPTTTLGNFTSTASSALGLGFNVVLQHTISASGIPALISPPTPDGTYDTETDFVYAATENNSFQFFTSAAAGSSSSSGNLTSGVPTAGIFLNPTQFSASGGSSGSTNSQGWDQSSGIATGLDQSPVPMPEEGIGHAAASSSASAANLGTQSGSEFSFRGKLKSDGKLSGITGDIRSRMQDAWDNSGNDHGVISLRIADSDETGNFMAGMVSGKNTTWQALISASADNALQVGLDSEGKLTATPADSETKINGGAGSGDANFEFIVTAGEGETQSGNTFSQWNAIGRSANASLSSKSIQVGAAISTGEIDPEGSPDQATFRENHSRHESEFYFGRNFVHTIDPTRTALNGSPAFTKHETKLTESWSFNSGALGAFTAFPDEDAEQGVGLEGNATGQSRETFLYVSDDSFQKQSITTGQPGIPPHQQWLNNQRHAKYSIHAETTINGNEVSEPVIGGDDRVIVTGTYYSQSGPIGGLVTSTLDLATGIVTIQSNIGIETDDGEGGTSSSTLNGMYQTPDWDPRTSYEHLLDGSPDPNPPSTEPMPPVVVIPAPRTKSWSEWGIELFAGRKGDAFDQGVNFVSGFGDGVTLGLTAKMRELHGMDYVDKDTWMYFGGDIASNFMPGPTAIAKPGTWLWKAYNKFDDLGVCANTFTKLVHGGCFVAGTPVTVSSLPYSAERESSLWKETDWLDSYNHSYSLRPASGRGVGGEGLAVKNHLLHSKSPLALQTSPFPLQTSLHLPIDQIPLGARIPTKNPKPWEYDDSLPEPDQATWAKVSITMHRNDGGIVDAELLRPRWWIAQHNIVAGKRLPMNIVELQVHGAAIVTAVDDCPEIASGEGSVVTARFTTREVNTIARAEIIGPDGTIELIEGTPIHPIWSVDRNDWVPLGELTEGETLQAAGGIATVLSLALVTCSLPVYNIEVHGEHVYEVGELGLLVHNDCLDYAKTVLRRRPDGVIVEMKGIHGAIGVLPGYGPQGWPSHYFHLQNGILRDEAFRKGIQVEQWLGKYAAENGMKVSEILDNIIFRVVK
ncbi:hypothetical protein SH449x_003652 [Pirellulaceae bacterium SH449]